jgi:hypothetical protein
MKTVTIKHRVYSGFVVLSTLPFISKQIIIGHNIANWITKPVTSLFQILGKGGCFQDSFPNCERLNRTKNYIL